VNAREITDLLRLEWQLDRQQKHVWGSMLLYVVSTVYTCYLGVDRITSIPIWNALFWIILLFGAFNALARSFQREDGGRQLYLHTLAHPRSVVLARTIYNAGVMLVLSSISLIAYVLFIGDQVFSEADPLLFLVCVLLGGIGLAFSLTLISAIAARAGSGLGLMAILGLPIVLPMLLATLRASKLALDGVAWSVAGKYLIGLVALDVLAVALSAILFPYLWRD
jgi:heme exporter protein B